MNDVSQGIIDTVLQIYKRSQLRAIQRGEIEGGAETIDPALIRWVAKKDFELIQPMLDARRRNDLAALREFDDLGPARLGRYSSHHTVQDPSAPTASNDGQAAAASAPPNGSPQPGNQAPKKTRTRKRPAPPPMTEDDLRSVAPPDVGNAYEALSEAGVTKSPLED